MFTYLVKHDIGNSLTSSMPATSVTYARKPPQAWVRVRGIPRPIALRTPPRLASFPPGFGPFSLLFSCGHSTPLRLCTHRALLVHNIALTAASSYCHVLYMDRPQLSGALAVVGRLLAYHDSARTGCCRFFTDFLGQSPALSEVC
jgi:hypothetical protein